MILVHCSLSLLMSIITYQWIKRPGVTPTRASSLLSLIAISILFIMSKYLDIDFYFLSALVFGSSFVGMCSHKIVSSVEVAFAALLFTFLYLFLVPKLGSLGGALGFSAFLSVLLSTIFNKVLVAEIKNKKC